MRNVTLWLVRRKPGDKRKFEVVSFAMKTGEAAVAKEFSDIGRARQFAEKANLKIGRNGTAVKNS